jgi:hypothetical protein
VIPVKKIDFVQRMLCKFNANSKSINLVDGARHRYLNGYVSRFSFERTDGDLTTYAATVVPWTHFMGLRVNCRIFQNQRVPEILKAIFADYGAAAKFEFRLAGGEASYPQETSGSCQAICRKKLFNQAANLSGADSLFSGVSGLR